MNNIVVQIVANLAWLSLAFTFTLPFIFQILKKTVTTQKGEQKGNLIWGDNKKSINNISVVYNKLLDAPINFVKYYNIEDLYINNYPTLKDKQREKVYIDIINSAGKYVHIITPFLQADEVMEDSLTNAVKRGVEIKIILAGSEKQTSSFTITKSQIEKLTSLGVEFFEYRNGLIYVNLCTSDDDKAMVDAVNDTNRALLYPASEQDRKRRNRSVGELEGDFERTVKKSVRL